MKIFIFQILFLVPLSILSQNTNILEIDWKIKSETQNEYVNLLNLKDTNSLIVKIGYSSYWMNGLKAKYIVYQNDGKIKKFEVFHPRSSELKTKIKKERIKKKHNHHYRNFLKKCVAEKMFEIDQSQLNIKEKVREEGTVEILSISDGTNYHFEICRGKNSSAYSSYEPERFIKNNFPGSKERQKLVDLITGFEKMIEKF